jgi:hypothetical protein
MTKVGKIYMWGAGDDGQLGLGDSSSRQVPSEIPEFVFRVPMNFEEEFRNVFSWLYLGRSDEYSLFSLLPVEIAFHFVHILIQ